MVRREVESRFRSVSPSTYSIAMNAAPRPSPQRVDGDVRTIQGRGGSSLLLERLRRELIARQLSKKEASMAPPRRLASFASSTPPPLAWR